MNWDQGSIWELITKGGWGGAQKYEYNYKGKGMHKSIALCNKVHEACLLSTSPSEGGGVHVPLPVFATRDILLLR